MKIVLGGDSTVADYPLDQQPMMGWGQALPSYLPPEVNVRNFAKNGSTTRSFIEEGLFEQLLQEVEPNTVVLLQFGHNDQKEKNHVTMEVYIAHLTDMIRQIKEKAGIPILCTPVERRVGEEGRLAHTLSAFLPVLRELSRTEEVVLFDLNRYTYHYYDTLGLEASKALFVWLAPNEHPNYPAGLADDTHFSKLGAHMIARYVAIRLQAFFHEQPLFPDIYYGACMYPEVWSEEIMQSDSHTMKTVGMNFARIGEFMWRDLEPQPGEYDFSLLERALEQYQANGIDVCLCIPTPTPPRWFAKQYPEALVTNQDGTKMHHGSRQHVCTNNEDFRRYAYRLTRKIAEIAEKHENVVMLQLDNEFKCHVDLCYCTTCQTRWHTYLKDSYQSVTNLNECWGTKVWSEWYDAFEDVVLPLTTPFLHNSSLMNAFRRFTTDTLNEFAHDLCHFIRMETALPITHNSAFGFNLQNDELFADLDIAGFDTYAPADNYPAYTMNLDRWRNVKPRNKEMLLLETCTANAGHIENYAAPRPHGFVTSEAFIGYAGNLKSFCFWHFRGHRYGVEQPHSAVLTAWGEPDRGYEEVARIGELRQQIAPLLAETKYVSAKIAIIYSDYSKRFYTIDHGGVYDYRSLFTEFYGSLIRQGIRVEIIQENSTLEEYDVVLAPFVRWISPTLLKKFAAFTEAGGKLILGPMTGDRTKELAWPATNGLDRLGEWLGFDQIQQFTVKGLTYQLTYDGLKELLDHLVTVFHCPEDWETIGRGNDQTLLAKKQVAQGEIIYLGALPSNLPDSLIWQSFCRKELFPYESERQLIKCSEGVMKYRRESATHVQLWISNLGLTTADFTLHLPGFERLSGEALARGNHRLEPYENLIIEWEKTVESEESDDSFSHPRA